MKYITNRRRGLGIFLTRVFESSSRFKERVSFQHGPFGHNPPDMTHDTRNRKKEGFLGRKKEKDEETWIDLTAFDL